MKKHWSILILLFSVNYPLFAVTPASSPDSLTPLILNNDTLDAITAGAVSSMATTNALAQGQTYARTQTNVLTNAIARQGVWYTQGKGVSRAQSDNLAFTEGSSISIAGTTGVVVKGAAFAVGVNAQANTSFRTIAIHTRYAEIAVGQVRSIACCGDSQITEVQASTFTDQNFNVSRITLREINTPRLSYSVGNAVIVSILHP